jgi:hypothetical protein
VERETACSRLENAFLPLPGASALINPIRAPERRREPRDRRRLLIPSIDLFVRWRRVDRVRGSSDESEKRPSRLGNTLVRFSMQRGHWRIAAVAVSTGGLLQGASGAGNYCKRCGESKDARGKTEQKASRRNDAGASFPASAGLNRDRHRSLFTAATKSSWVGGSQPSPAQLSSASCTRSRRTCRRQDLAIWHYSCALRALAIVSRARTEQLFVPPCVPSSVAHRLRPNR